MKMEEKKKLVLDYLATKRMRTGDWFSPTVIGEDVLSPSAATSGSSVASPVCKNLVKDGLVERNKRGWYRLKR